jgi:tetratricopeptide (TPR) repeat protein
MRHLHPILVLGLSLVLLVAAAPVLAAGAASDALQPLLCGAERPESRPRDEAWLRDDLACLRRQPRDAALLREVGISYATLALPDRPERLGRAEQHLRRALTLRPGDALARAWLGSTLSQQAEDAATGSIDRTRAAEGLALMDEAIAQDGADPRLRVLRGEAHLRIPEPISSPARLAEDVAAVESAMAGGPLPLPTRAACELLLGRYAQRQGDAEAASQRFERVIALAPGTRFESAARQLLAGAPPAAHAE